MSQGASNEVAKLAQEIRELKAALTSEGLTKDAINRHEVILAKVAALQALKSKLASDDPARDEAIMARLQEERHQRHQQEQATAKAQQAELKAIEDSAPRPLIQRKIFHLFCYAGNGDSFHYEPPPQINAADCSFGEGLDPHPPVFVTEKWDGTTMQATSRYIFKRLDLWGKRKSADPSQRYDLRLVAWRGEDDCWHGLDFIDADARVREAVTPYLDRLAKLDDGLCVYFEVVHTDINVTFKHLSGFADIRVFDFSQKSSSSSTARPSSGRFLPFEETIKLAERFALPLVGWELHSCLDAIRIWNELVQAAQGRQYASAAAQLEGFVVREAGDGDRIAKARVAHLLPSAESFSAAQPAATRGYLLWERQALSFSYLADIGLSGVAVSSDRGC